MVIDFHTHIFPDAIAEKTIRFLGEKASIRAKTDGTAAGLLHSMEEGGTDLSVILPVLTKPSQFRSILSFAERLNKTYPQRLFSFGGIHPDSEQYKQELRQIRDAGLLGVKLHPDFQKFHINDRAAYPIYEAIEGELPLLIHTGDSRYPFSDPKRVPQVLRDFPKLQMICAHFGGWSQWNEAERVLAGQNVWIDTSSSLYALSPAKARELIAAFGEERVLFGSDYPMWTPGAELENILRLGLSERTMQKIFYKNLSELLHLGL